MSRHVEVEQGAPSSALPDTGRRSAVRSPVEVGRNGAVAAVLGIGAAAVAIAFLSRAVAGGGLLDWGCFLALAVLARVHLGALVDARSPLLVADERGVRMRLGARWHAAEWEELREVEVRQRRGRWSDGRLVVVPRDLETVLDGLDARGRRRAGFNRRWYAAPLAVPLGLTTRSTPEEGELASTLARLAGHRTTVLERHLDRVPGAHAAPVTRRREASTPPHGAVPRVPTQASAPGSVPGAAQVPLQVPRQAPVPLRPARRALRAELTRSEPAGTMGAVALDWQPAWERDGGSGHLRLPEEDELRRPADVDPLLGLYQPPDPVIGPRLATARTQLGLSIDELADRTRIRPHVIEAIEVDDFTSCGGDFYARGHLRTLARVLGTDAAPLVATYDARYATAPIDARRVFEAELAHGTPGGLRGTLGGPRWAVLAGTVLTLLLVWGLVRLFATQPPELVRPAPIVLDGSAGVSHTYPDLRPTVAPKVPVVLTVSRATDVVVRDGSGHRVFRGQLAAPSTKRLRVSPPVTVRASDAGAVAVSVAGTPKGLVGQDGVDARRTFHRPSHGAARADR